MQPQPTFFNHFAPIERHRHHLPHWDQGTVWQIVTWRLADSLPAGKLAEWNDERDAWLRRHPEPWDATEEREYRRLFHGRLDDWLDAGHGACVLRDPHCAGIVADAFRHFDEARYLLASFVVMPNHVHVMLAPLNGFQIDTIVHSWKSYTATMINRHLNRRGQLWQEDYWDRIIRDHAHYANCVRYIHDNPAKARLSPGEYILHMKDIFAEQRDCLASSP